MTARRATLSDFSPRLTVTFTEEERRLAREIRSLLLRYDTLSPTHPFPRQVSARLHPQSALASEHRDDLRAFAR